VILDEPEANLHATSVAELAAPIRVLWKSCGAVAAATIASSPALHRADDAANLTVPQSMSTREVLRMADIGLNVSESDLRRLFELSLDMVGTAGFDGRFRALNSAWESALGFTREELLAVPYVDFIHPDDIASTMRAAEGLTRAQNAVLFENRYRHKDGSYRWLQWNSTAYMDEGLVYFVARDITESKRIELELAASVERLTGYAEELARKNHTLEVEIRDRTRAEEALAAQQRTIQSMSTPIIRAWRGVLVLPIVGHVDAARASGVMERLLSEIVATGAAFSILDLTGADGVDATTASHILTIGRAVALLGSRCLLSGISPSMATVIVQTDASLGEISTFGRLEDALRHALAALEGRRARPAMETNGPRF
jgi:PAS domain S-box-containing protein